MSTDPARKAMNTMKLAKCGIKSAVKYKETCKSQHVGKVVGKRIQAGTQGCLLFKGRARIRQKICNQINNQKQQKVFLSRKG